MSVLSRAQIEALIHRVAGGLSAVELVHTPHERWPYPPRSRKPLHSQASHHESSERTAGTNTALKISVLDSSFNPPTLAHLALASLLAPAAPSNSEEIARDFDARLLLLSVRNADKSLKPSDATYVQRLEMMIRLSKEVLPVQPERPQVSAPDLRTDPDNCAGPNVAVAIIDEPTFVGKARKLSGFLRERTGSLAAPAASFEDSAPAHPDLTFIVGIDTLERILATRYYPSPSEMRLSLKQFMSSTRLLCARRVMSGQLIDVQEECEKEVFALAQEYLDVTKLSIVDIGGTVEAYSSSEVRQRIAQGDNEIWTRMVTSSIAEYVRDHGLYVSSTISSQ